MKKLKIIKTFISLASYKEFVLKLLELSSASHSSYVCVANVHMTIEAYNDKEFLDVVNQADLVTPDGMTLAKSIKYIYGIPQDRVAGMDLIEDLFKESSRADKRVYVYGSTEETLQKLQEKVRDEYPNLALEVYSPAFRVLSPQEKEEHVKSINDFQADFVFVALGCPKQEKWMAEHKEKINACMVGLGGAIEVYAGVKQRAPKWMQENSLEWLYRLSRDPKRLWKRPCCLPKFSKSIHCFAQAAAAK